MKFAEKFLNMMKLSDADDETEPFDEEYNEVTEEGYDSDEEEEDEEDFGDTIEDLLDQEDEGGFRLPHLIAFPKDKK